MPLQETDFKLSSKKIYAFDLSTIRESASISNYLVCEGISVSKEKGATVITYGSLAVGFETTENKNVLEALENVDMRYGLRAKYKWDGVYMHAPEATLAEMNEAAEKLGEILENLPNLPEGFTNWYVKR